jgi:hypothetical protein
MHGVCGYAGRTYSDHYAPKTKTKSQRTTNSSSYLGRRPPDGGALPPPPSHLSVARGSARTEHWSVGRGNGSTTFAPAAQCWVASGALHDVNATRAGRSDRALLRTATDIMSRSGVSKHETQQCNTMHSEVRQTLPRTTKVICYSVSWNSSDDGHHQIVLQSDTPSSGSWQIILLSSHDVNKRRHSEGTVQHTRLCCRPAQSAARDATSRKVAG